jgi:N utilization substance protein A
LGWRIDIKSEEEKRQEVESAMAALVSPGAPLSVLIDFGLGETLAEKLVESGVGTVEKLGSMTPEDLEAIQGIGPKMVEKIQEAVNAYYGQFDTGAEPVEAGPSPGEASLNEVEASQAEASRAEPATGQPGQTTGDVETEGREVGKGVEPPDSVAPESDTIRDINSSAQTPDENGEVHES